MLNIAIDGPSGAGKSTVAKLLAKKLGIVYLDTGAMYRGMGYKAVSLGIDPNDEPNVVKMLESTTLDVKYVDGNQLIFVDGVDVTPFIREHKISKAASDISKIGKVRQILVFKQQEIAKSTAIVLDGRDITTKVLPNSQNKFFLTASPEIRAQRRYEELTAKGQSVVYEDILKDVIDRDYNDSHRANSPLTCTDDSVYVDSTNMSVDQVLDFIISKLRLDV